MDKPWVRKIKASLIATGGIDMIDERCFNNIFEQLAHKKHQNYSFQQAIVGYKVAKVIALDLHFDRPYRVPFTLKITNSV